MNLNDFSLLYLNKNAHIVCMTFETCFLNDDRRR